MRLNSLKILTIPASLFLICACGGSGGGGGGSSSAKSIQSIWTAESNGGVLDLRSIVLGSSESILFTFTNGAECTCTGEMSGSQTSGTYSVTGCAYSGGGSGDPGCAGVDQSGTYTNSNNVLQYCDPTCASYQ